MQIAFCLTKYFPYGGLQRDFLRIATICQQRGHQVRVLTMRWEGEQPEGFDVREIEPRVREQRSRLYRRGNRYRKFRAFEEAVFSTGVKTEILMIAAPQIAAFQQYYGTPAERFHLLPPGISRDRVAPADADAQRVAFRQKQA